VKRNPRAQEELYARFYGIMLPVCLRYVGHKEEAQEVLNDAFLKIFESIASFKSKGSFEGWVRRIVINKCLDYLRSTAARKRATDTTELFLYTSAISSETDEDAEWHYLSWLLNQLPEQHKKVFNLFVIDGFNHKEISDMLSISISNSKYCLHQARKALQENYKRLEENERSE